MRSFYMILLFVLYLSFGCRDSFMGDEPSGDNPVEIFDVLWQDFDSHYACFGLRGTNWDSLYEVYRGRLWIGMSEDLLWNVVTEMLDELADQHVSIERKMTGGFSQLFISGLDEVKKKVWFSTVMLNKYIDTPTLQYSDQIISSVVSGTDIGYLYVGAMIGYDINILHNALREATKYPALILDLRINSGGTYEYVKAIDSWLSTSDNVMWGVQVRNGPGHRDFGEKVWLRNKKAQNPYQGKIAVLTNRATVSAGEWAVESLVIGNNVTVIGDTTAGCLSTVGMTRFLPNGWMYKYAVQRITRADGSSYEGVGMAPDILIQNSRTTYSRWEDSVMITAIKYLKTKNVE